jgi:serine/threonine protein kinase/TM2 domain-containing membrane protein YozV
MSERPSDQPTIRPEEPKGPPRPDEIAGHFPQLEILDILGHGGMGAVYKARQVSLDRMVALKILPPHRAQGTAFAERFNREARALARLQHPNIVAVHDCGCIDGLCYLVMEYVDGTNLRGMMKAGQITPREALSIIPELCDALQYAHDEGVLHRDIKPENILVDLRGRVKVVDFGLAKLVAGGATAATEFTLTQPQQVMGTMHYMAPEQVECPAKVDHRADIYALGVVFYEMLTGELPIGRFPLPSEKTPLDGRLDQIVLQALEKDPERRYQKASEVKTDVQAVVSAHPPGAPAPAPVMVPGERSSVLHAAQAPSSVASTFSLTGGRKTEIAYVLWLACLLGFCGIHRMYAGRWITGILWLLTGGLCFVGQFVDLFLIPRMILQANIEAQLQRGAV